MSSEAMTNIQGVFSATLAAVKKNDDFNFISGINHSVLHGYNYSPPEAGFPGWVRFGAYFSDQNTWCSSRTSVPSVKFILVLLGNRRFR